MIFSKGNIESIISHNIFLHFWDESIRVGLIIIQIRTRIPQTQASFRVESRGINDDLK
jgi:hypothetical protein